jgi:hypothetical protein
VIDNDRADITGRRLFKDKAIMTGADRYRVIASNIWPPRSNETRSRSNFLKDVRSISIAGSCCRSCEVLKSSGVAECEPLVAHDDMA